MVDIRAGVHFPPQLCVTCYSLYVALTSKIHHNQTYTTAQTPSTHQVTMMLTTSKNVLFPDHNHLQVEPPALMVGDN